MISNTLGVLVFGMVAMTLAGCAKSDSSDDPGADPAAAGADLSASGAAGSKCKTSTGVKDCSSQTNRAKAISREVFAMKDDLTSGEHTFTRGTAKQSADPIELVKMYIKHSESDDPTALDGYKFNASMKAGFPSDQQVAGVFAQSAIPAMIDEATKDVEDTFQDGKASKDVKKHLQNLVNLGVLFGTDGFQQNGCAAPTIYLLVIDTAGKTVDGIDLTPCDES
jgi:hypothetical protein